MKIILLENVAKLGKTGDIVTVKPGFARNYLLPKAAALEATPANLNVFKGRKAELERMEEKRREEARAVVAKLEKLSLTIAEEAKEDEDLFGSVTAATISAALAKEQFDVKKEQILLVETITRLGVYSVRVRLHPDVEGEVKVWVVKK